MKKNYILLTAILLLFSGCAPTPLEKKEGKKEEALPSQSISSENSQMPTEKNTSPINAEKNNLPEDLQIEKTATAEDCFDIKTFPKEIQAEIIKTGEGRCSKEGDTLLVHYTGTFLDGKKFDSSLDRNEPFEFTLGAGQVIKGWDIGMLGMKIGEKRMLKIEPSFAYGENGIGPIPPNTPLQFEVELLGIK